MAIVGHFASILNHFELESLARAWKGSGRALNWAKRSSMTLLRGVCVLVEKCKSAMGLVGTAVGFRFAICTVYAVSHGPVYAGYMPYAFGFAHTRIEFPWNFRRIFYGPLRIFDTKFDGHHRKLYRIFYRKFCVGIQKNTNSLKNTMELFPKIRQAYYRTAELYRKTIENSTRDSRIFYEHFIEVRC